MASISSVPFLPSLMRLMVDDLDAWWSHLESLDLVK